MSKLLFLRNILKHSHDELSCLLDSVDLDPLVR